MNEKKSNYFRILMKFVNYLWHLSIKRRIFLAIMLAFILVLPVVGTSLFYFSNILENINTIIDQDVELGKITEDLSLTMLSIRRYERNYRALGSTKDRDKVLKLISEAESLIKEANEIAPPDIKISLDEMYYDLETYTNSFSGLTEFVSQNPPEDRINNIVRSLSGSFDEFRTNYLGILKKLVNASPAERDSIIAKASESMNFFSNENLDNLFSSGNTDLPSYIRENLENSGQRFLDKSKFVSDKSWENMLIHREESRKAEARAQRNLISILILTALISIIVITVLPKKIVRPITYFTQIMKRAGEGDFNVYANINTNDEIGVLAANYNLAIEKIRQFDSLKTAKISSQKRVTERLLEMLRTPVCILSSDYCAYYYNSAFATIFGPVIPVKPPEGGLDIHTYESLEDFHEKIQKKVLNSVNEFVIDISGYDSADYRFKGRIIRNTLMELESIVILGIPAEKN